MPSGKTREARDVVEPKPAKPSLSEEVGAEVAESDEDAVERERAEVREFVKGLSGDDIKSGGWFTKLLAGAFASYTRKVDWTYFQDKYEGLPADAVVDQRIKMAARYAAIEGGLSASAYTGAIAATIGTGGGASPATLPAAVATVMVDVVYITQLQLKLAYDVAVLYRVPLDPDDPDDLWKLIRVAFTIKGGEVAREGVVKAVPVLVRPLIKKFYSKGVLQAAKGLPIVGKYLLQRNAIKIGIPAVGVPLSVVLNRYTTLVAGRHARAVFRNEARILELAQRLMNETRHPQLALWVAWAVIDADKRMSDDKALLLRHLVRLAKERHDVVDEQLARVVEVDLDVLWRRLDAEEGDLSDLRDLARRVAAVDGPASMAEQALIDAVDEHCPPPAA